MRYPPPMKLLGKQLIVALQLINYQSPHLYRQIQYVDIDDNSVLDLYYALKTMRMTFLFQVIFHV
ncbi:hypothetical protein D3C86_1699170 [compost metagenome]